MMQARLIIRAWDGRHDRRIGHAQVRDGADPAVLVDRCHQIARRAHPGRAAGPGTVAAADRGRRGVAAAAPALRLPGHRRDPGLLGPGKHRRRGGPVVRSCGRPGLVAGLRGGHTGLRGAGADRADTRLLPVPQPPGQGARTQEPPITSRWLSTAPAARDPSNLADTRPSGGLYARRSSSSVRFR